MLPCFLAGSRIQRQELQSALNHSLLPQGLHERTPESSGATLNPIRKPSSSYRINHSSAVKPLWGEMVFHRSFETHRYLEGWKTVV